MQDCPDQKSTLQWYHSLRQIVVALYQYSTNNSHDALKSLLFLEVQQFSSILLLSVHQNSKFIDMLSFLHFWQSLILQGVKVLQIEKLHNLSIYSGRGLLTVTEKASPDDIIEFSTLVSSQLSSLKAMSSGHIEWTHLWVIKLNISPENKLSLIFLIILNRWHYKCWLVYFMCFSLMCS